MESHEVTYPVHASSSDGGAPWLRLGSSIQPKNISNVDLEFFSIACIGNCRWYTLIFWLGPRVHSYIRIHLPHRH